MSIEAPPLSLARWFWGDWWRLVRTFDQVAAFDRSATPTSWYRDPLTNQRVGGDPFSQHLIGTALDLVERPEAREVWRRAGFVVVPESDHDHVQIYPAGFLRRLLEG